jgi:PAS domain S-box-containing protein
MDLEVESRRVAFLEAASRRIGTAVALLACLVLVGWASDIATLKQLLPGLVTMKANTAVAFVLAAVPLALGRDRRTWRLATARGCAALVALIGFLTLTQYALGWDLQIDEWLFRDAANAPGTSHPGRMAPVTALGFVLLGFAEMTLDHAREGAVGQWSAIAAGYLGVLNLVGYAYRFQGLSHLYSPALAYTEMAVHAAGAFVVLGGAVLCARPDRGMMAIVTSQTAGGIVARRLLPAALGLPFVLGWLRLLGERAGLWTFQAGFALQVFSTLTLLVVIVWRISRVLHGTDTQRQQVEAALRRTRDELETQVQQRTQDLRETVHTLQGEVDERQRVEQALRESERCYRELVDSSRGLICTHDLDGILLSVNPAAAQLLGYTSAELVGKSLRDVLAPAVQDLLPEYLERIRQAPADEGLMRVVTRAGEERLWTYSNVRYEEPGRPPYVLGHAQDITALKRAEHLARQAEALRSVAELANAAAHEINNPLAVVAGHLDMLKGQTSNDPDTLARIDKATAAVYRIRTIVGSMAKITRLERLKWAPNLPPLLDLRRSAAPAAEEAPGADEAPQP